MIRCWRSGRGAAFSPARYAPSAGSVTAVELDPQLVEYLTKTLADCRNLDLRRGDALEFPIHTLPAGTVVVANLPYYVSTPLLFKLLDTPDRIDRMVLMLQTEVARRLVAKPSTSEYGVLSVLTQYWTEPFLAFRVPATCFRPRPEVDSAVVRLMIRESPSVHVKDKALFTRIVRAAFAHRRKTFSNSLRDEGLQAEQISRAMSQAGIDPSRRAETLACRICSPFECSIVGLALNILCSRRKRDLNSGLGKRSYFATPTHFNHF